MTVMQPHLQIPDIVTRSLTIASLIVQKVKVCSNKAHFQTTRGSCNVSISVCLLSAVLTTLTASQIGETPSQVSFSGLATNSGSSIIVIYCRWGHSNLLQMRPLQVDSLFPIALETWRHAGGRFIIHYQRPLTREFKRLLSQLFKSHKYVKKQKNKNKVHMHHTVFFTPMESASAVFIFRFHELNSSSKSL